MHVWMRRNDNLCIYMIIYNIFFVLRQNLAMKKYSIKKNSHRSPSELQSFLVEASFNNKQLKMSEINDLR